ncbi:MAG: proline--tRNA ligase [Candidatus Magasanikbacteria bacterium]
MKQSQLPIKTRKENPSDEEARNAQLLIRAGYIDKLMAGAYSQLPLGLRVIENIISIISEEMEELGAKRILMPALHPKETWDMTGRWEQVEEMYKLQDNSGSRIALGFTHEEVISQIAKNNIESYKDLPFSLYQVQTKFRDEERPKSGLLRGREFTMKDLYSFHESQVSLNDFYERAKEVYFKIYDKVGVGEKTFLTFADGGSFSKYSHEFQTISPVGEDTIYLCKECEVAVNEEIIDEQEHCPQCNQEEAFETHSAIEVGNIFKLGTKFSEPIDLNYKTQEDEVKNVIMASYGIGVERLMGSIVEVSHDDRGIIWPQSVAPFDAHLLVIGESTERKLKEGQKVYKKLSNAGLEILFDDRNVSPGQKFSEADLMGMPYRLVVSENTIEQNKIEIKRRDDKKEKLVDLSKAKEIIQMK